MEQMNIRIPCMFDDRYYCGGDCAIRTPISRKVIEIISKGELSSKLDLPEWRVNEFVKYELMLCCNPDH